MRTFSALWIAYQAQQNPVWRYQTLALIDGQTYVEAEICSFSRRGGLTANEFGIGNCRIQELSITVLAKTGIAIAKNARVEVAVRITGADGNTPYYWLGTYFVDNRKQLSGGKTQLNCLDRMAYADQPFLTPGEDLDDYPMLMTTALSRIYTATGTTLDSRSTINSTWTIDYPNEMTMRQVAEQIASAHGGNFYVTESSKLRLVKPGYTTAVAAINGSNAVRILQLNVPTTYDSVAMIYTEEGSYYESGATKLVTLNVSNSWATQAITDAAAAVIAGYTYTPMSVRSADLDPAIELGDHVTIDGVDCNILEWEWDNRFYCNLEGPSQQEDATSEFGYTGTLTQALAKKVSLGSSYYGTTISRSAGLRIAKSDGSSEAVFNSDKLALRAKVGGVMVDKVFFDPVTGQYVFDGDIQMRSGAISWGPTGVASDPTIATAQSAATSAASAASDAAAAVAALKTNIGYTYINQQYVIAPHIIGGDITGTTITGNTITGNTITGGVFRTSAAGERVEIDDANRIHFKDSAGATRGSIRLADGYLEFRSLTYPIRLIAAAANMDIGCTLGGIMYASGPWNFYGAQVTGLTVPAVFS